MQHEAVLTDDYAPVEGLSGGSGKIDRAHSPQEFLDQSSPARIFGECSI